MPSITTWTRLEPICRDDDMRSGLEARVHDPLWLLGRQWQMHEFRSEDAGSPVTARIKAKAYPLTRYHAGVLPDSGAAKGGRYDPLSTPLETLVEQEPAVERGASTLRQAIDAGRHFLRLAAAHGATEAARAFLVTHALEAPPPPKLAALDPDTRALYAACAGRVIDGARLFRHLAKDAPKTGALGKTASAWVAWYRARFAEPSGPANPAWLNDRLEYRFAVSAHAVSEEVVLESPEYLEGRLDWYDFTVRGGASLGAKRTDAKAEALERTLVPAPVAYAGMPAERWWQFEDARIHFGAVDVQPGDLVSSVLLQFAIIFGNDWFVVPLSAKVGSLCEIETFVITDSFGVTTEIAPFSRAHPEWQLFSLTQEGRETRRDLFFLPPVLTHATAGPVLEEVFLGRDEVANLAWAVERRVEGLGGAILDRRALVEPPVPEEPLPPAPRLQYQLMSTPPEAWVPLIPIPDSVDGRGIRLQRGRIDRPAQGRIVGGPSSLAIANEEIPKTGVIVTRAAQWARWIDGSSQLWIGRRKLPGSSEASSGMRFDLLRAKQP